MATKKENAINTATTESPILKQYRENKKKNPDTIMLFRIGDFYELYEEDARASADVLGLPDDITIAQFPHQELDTYLPKLIRAGKRVAICDQLELPKKLPKRGVTATTGTPITTKEETTMTAENESKNVQHNAPVENMDEQVVSVDNSLPEVRLVTYTTKKGATAPQIIGFGGENDTRWKRLYDEKPKWVSVSWYKDVSGEKLYRLVFGVRYMEAAKALTEAYNTADREAWKKAESNCQAVYKQAQADGKAQWEAKKEEWAAKRESKKAKSEQPNVKTYTEQEVAALMQRVMRGDKDALEQVNAMMQKVV